MYIAPAFPNNRQVRAGAKDCTQNYGEVAEWSKAHAWKVCRRVTVSRVRIPVSPPLFLSRHSLCSSLRGGGLFARRPLGRFGYGSNFRPNVPPFLISRHSLRSSLRWPGLTGRDRLCPWREVRTSSALSATGFSRSETPNYQYKKF